MNGQPAYKRVRNGEIIEMKSRKVSIKEIKLLNYEWPFLTINVTCQKGTYIRSLARDIGIKLNTGGHLKNLIRTRIGNFKITDADIYEISSLA